MNKNHDDDDESSGLRHCFLFSGLVENYFPREGALEACAARQEVSRMLDLLWAAGPDAGPTKTSLRQLVQLTSEVEGIAEASRASLVAKAAARYRAARNRAARPRAAREQRERERGGGHSECPLLFSFCANNAFIQDSRVQELNYYINYYNIRR